MDYPIYHDMEQGSDKWLEAKSGLVSASNFSKAKGKPGQTRTLYMLRLIAERLTGEPQATYSNANMDRGTELEPLARAYYEALNDCIVKQVGFIQISDDVGVSPDGLVGTDGAIEAKCPLPSTHIAYILANREVAVYRPQVQGLMMATGREWVDFISYCPEVKRRPYWCKRIKRDEEYISDLNAKIDLFVKEMKGKMAQIEGPKF